MNTVYFKLRRLMGQLLLGGMLLTTGMVNAQINLPGTDVNSFRFTENNYQTLGVRATQHELSFINVSTAKGQFCELAIPGYHHSNLIGAPKVPVMRKLIEVPLGASFKVKVNRSHYRDYTLAELGLNHPLMPAQAPVSKSADLTALPFDYDQELYAKDAFLFDDIATVEEVGIMRGVRMANLTIYPVQYNPVSGILRIYDDLDISVNFPGADVQATLDLQRKTASPYFGAAYKSLANYRPVQMKELIEDAPVTYVIVSDPMFQSALQPFIEWKVKRGFKVIEAYTNDPTVGNTTTSIKNYLQGLYNNPPAGYNVPSFVLFVGDVAQIPAWNGTAGSHVTDLYYCEYTGDKIPELYYGRFSATNLTQLQPQIDKTLEYERYLFPDESFLGEALLVAGADASHQLTWGNGQVNYGTSNYFNAAHNIMTLALLQPEAGGANYHQQILNKVSSGVAIANYSAHCSEDGWADPSFSISDIATLTNNHKYCLMVSNCCLSTKFEVNSFGEEQLRAANKGSVGHIGGSNSSYWDEDYYWACGFKTVVSNPVYDPNHLGAFDKTFHENGEDTDDWFVTQGQMVVGGNLAVEESSSTMKTYYWEIYHLMGDPSLMIYYSVPQPVVATYSSTMLVGFNALDVQTEEHAYVALSMNGTLLDAKVAGPSGLVNLSFSPLTNVGNADIVVIKQNRKPHINQIGVVPATGPYVVVQNVAVNDSLGNNNGMADFDEDIFLNVTFKNVGVQTATSVETRYQTADNNLDLIDSTQSIASIAPNSTKYVRNAYRMKVASFVQDQHKVEYLMTMTDGTNNWSFENKLTLNAPVLQVLGLTIDDATTGNNNGILDAGETVKVKVQTKNVGHTLVLNTPCNLSVAAGSENYLLVTNPNYVIPSLGVNQTKEAEFTVMSNIITPAMTEAGLVYQILAGSQGQYSAVSTLPVIVGENPSVNFTSSKTMNVCSANFFDGGGPDNNYAINQTDTITFMPATPGAKLKVTFTEFNVETNSTCSWDYLRLYNGATTTAPQIGQYCGTTIPPAFTATNADGALTFLFRSDNQVTKSGWKAVIECIGGNLTTTVAAFPPDVCTGSTTQLGTLTVGGTGNYTYLWSPAQYLDNPTSATPIATVSENVTFTCQVSDGSTQVNGNAPVAVHEFPQAPVASYNGTVLSSSVASGNQWYLNDVIIPGAVNQTYVPVQNGNYSVTTSNSYGCESGFSNAVAVQLVGIDNPVAVNNLAVFPNPFKNQLMVSYSLDKEANVTIELLNSLGQVIKTVSNEESLSAGQHQIEVNTDQLMQGVYFLKMRNGSAVSVVRVVKTR